MPDLNTGKRLLKTIVINDEIVGLSIVKRTKNSAKLCTLKVRDKYRGFGVGHKLLKSTLNDLFHKNCKNVHFTISEEILNQCNSFFTDYGFRLSNWKKNYYVKGRDELIFSASVNELKKGLEKQNILLSTIPEYIELIKKKEESVEFGCEVLNQQFSIREFYRAASLRSLIKFSILIHGIGQEESGLVYGRYKRVKRENQGFSANFLDEVPNENSLSLLEMKTLLKWLSMSNLEKRNSLSIAPHSHTSEVDSLSKMWDYDKHR